MMFFHPYQRTFVTLGWLAVNVLSLITFAVFLAHDVPAVGVPASFLWAASAVAVMHELDKPAPPSE